MSNPNRHVYYDVVQDTAYGSSTATFTFSGDVPQNGTGTLYRTIEYTPKRVGNLFVLEVEGQCGANQASTGLFALFKDADANALATYYGETIHASGWAHQFWLQHKEIIADLDTREYHFRYGRGGGSATNYINSFNDSSSFFGAASFVTFRLTEYEVCTP
jgi:hypothetical protein